MKSSPLAAKSQIPLSQPSLPAPLLDLPVLKRKEVKLKNATTIKIWEEEKEQIT
jgi:hypothetical protein